MGKIPSGNTPLMIAVQNGSLRTVKYFMAHGARIRAKNRDKQTLIFSAVYRDIDVPSKYKAIRAGGGETEYEKKAFAEYMEVLQIVVDTGVKINHQDNRGNTVLHIMVEADLPNVVEFLLAHGAREDIPNNNNKTPLELSKSKPEVESVIKEFIALRDKQNTPEALILSDVLNEQGRITKLGKAISEDKAKFLTFITKAPMTATDKRTFFLEAREFINPKDKNEIIAELALQSQKEKATQALVAAAESTVKIADGR